MTSFYILKASYTRESREMVLMNLFAGQEKRRRGQRQRTDCGHGAGGWRKKRVVPWQPRGWGGAGW